MQNKFTDSEIKDALVRAFRFFGEDKLTHAMYDKFVKREQNPDNPHPLTIIRRYGKWNDAIESIGLIPTKSRSNYSNKIDESAGIKGIQLAFQQLGHWPSRKEYDNLWRNGHDEPSIAEPCPPFKDMGYPSEPTIRSRMKWTEALAQARAS